jgi:hypothetical protein
MKKRSLYKIGTMRKADEAHSVSTFAKSLADTSTPPFQLNVVAI